MRKLKNCFLTTTFFPTLPTAETQFDVFIDGTQISSSNYSYSSPTLTFSSTNVNADVQATNGAPLSGLTVLVRENQRDEAFGNYDATKAARNISNFVNDLLSNWYVRLTRRRFWKGDYEKDKISGYQTLFECLLTISKLCSPIAPFYSDSLYKDLCLNTGFEKFESVHLSDFPKPKTKLRNLNLLGSEKDFNDLIKIKVRSTGRLLKAKIFIKDDNAKVEILDAETGISPGQASVFYSKDENGYKVFGPSKYASKLESSKIFARKFMDKYNIPQPCFFECKNEEEVISVATKLGFPIVLKADGLAAGKGVIICYNQRDLDEALDIMFKDRKFGSAAKRISVEECLKGQELSIFCLLYTSDAADE